MIVRIRSGPHQTPFVPGLQPSSESMPSFVMCSLWSCTLITSILTTHQVAAIYISFNFTVAPVLDMMRFKEAK